MPDLGAVLIRARTRSRRTGARPTTAFGASCLLLLLAPPACNSDGKTVSCDRPGDFWCEENAITACLSPQRERFVHEPVLEHGVDCADYGGTCVEWRDERDFDAAGCALPGGGCDEVGQSLCIDEHNLGYCQPPLRYIMYGCAGDYCQVNNAQEAVCRLAPGSCSLGDRLCDPDQPRYFLVCGGDGTWYKRIPCTYEDQVCTQLTETTIQCASP